MPEWGIHDKWAERMGISAEVSNNVNILIDFPKECPEYLDFCAEITRWSDYYEGKSSRWPFTARKFRDIEVLQSQLRSLRRDHPEKFCKILYILRMMQVGVKIRICRLTSN